VKAFFRTHYAPNNLSLVLAGDFDPAEARRLVDKYFGSIAPGPALTRQRVDVPRLDAETVVEIEDRVSLERVVLAWPTPEIGAADEPALTLLTSILSEGLSSRLQKALIYDKQLCTEVGAIYDTGEVASMFLIDASVRPGVSMLEVERAISAELALLAQNGPTVAELQRARTRTLTSVTSSLQSIGVGGVPTLLNYYNVYFGDPGKLSWDLERLVSVTSQNVRAVSAKWLTKNRAVLRFRPVTAAQAKLAAPDRSKPPALAPDAPFHVPSVATSRLPNGLELFVVERHELPLVSVALLSRAGSVLDPPGKQGLAKLVAHTMGRGTRSRNALAIEEALGDLGTTLSTAVELERVQHALEVQKENLPKALDLVADIVRSPSFPASELERERKLQLDEIDAVEDDASMLARRLRRVFSFGPGHPYGRPVLGDRTSLGGLTAADALALHNAAWRPDTSALVMVGDITLAEAVKLAQASFGGWSGVGATPPEIPAPRPLAPGKLVIVDKPGAEQTVVVQLLAAPQRKNAEYFSLRLASEVLGTGVSGRLYANLRQDKGYSYGIGSYVNALSGGMTWHVLGSVQTDATAPSITELVKEQRGLAGAIPIEAKELENARLGLLRNYAADFDENLSVAKRICDLWSRRWPIEELAQEQAGLQRATLKEVQAAAKQYAVATQASFLLVGDRSKIEAKLRALKVADVIVVDAQGRPLTNIP
jgi:zinc protease